MTRPFSRSEFICKVNCGSGLPFYTDTLVLFVLQGKKIHLHKSAEIDAYFVVSEDPIVTKVSVIMQERQKQMNYD